MRAEADGRQAAVRGAAPALAHGELRDGLAREPRERLDRPSERHGRADRDVPGNAQELLELRFLGHTPSVVMVPANPSWRAASKMFHAKG